MSSEYPWNNLHTDIGRNYLRRNTGFMMSYKEMTKMFPKKQLIEMLMT